MRAHAIRHDRSKVWKLYSAVEFISMIEVSRLVLIEVESRSQTPSLLLRHQLFMHLLTTFYHMHRYNYTATGDVVKFTISFVGRITHFASHSMTLFTSK
jgi:hypothetical protein